MNQMYCDETGIPAETGTVCFTNHWCLLLLTWFNVHVLKLMAVRAVSGRMYVLADQHRMRQLQGSQH